MKTKIFFFIIFFTLTNLCGQNINSFTHFNQKDGLPSNGIQTVFQDKLGYIWIGSNNGLTRYDGYEFTNFSVVNNDTNFLQLPLTTSLFDDSKGNIWIGAVGGITKYNKAKKSFRLYTFNEHERKEKRTFVVTSIQEADNGDLLIGMGDFFYRKFKDALYTIRNGNDKLEVLKISEKDSTNLIFQISKIEKSRFIFCGFNGIGEYDHQKKSFLWYNTKDKLVVTSFTLENENKLWFGTPDGKLYQYNIKTKEYEIFQLPNVLDIKSDYYIINKLIFDQNRNLLIATNRGLYHFNKKLKNFKLVSYDLQNPSSLHSYEINDLLLDKTGSIWIGTSDNGLSKFNSVQNSFQSYSHDPNDPKSIQPGWVNTIFEYNNDEVWFRGQTNVISKFNKKTKKFSNIPLPTDGWIDYIYKDASQKIWMGGGSGLYEVNPKLWSFKKVDIALDDSQLPIHVMLKDQQKRFWIGTHHGLFIYDYNNNQLAKTDFISLGIGDIGSNAVYNLVEDTFGNIWIGTDNGLFKFSNIDRQYMRIGASSDSTKNMNSQDVNSLYIDNDGTVWAGTWLGGLNKIDPTSGKVKTYTEKNGLKAHSVQGILGDEKNGSLWISTFDGIFRFDIADETFHHFGIEEGIQGNQFADRAALKTKEGEYVFGGQNGVTIFKTEDIKSDLVPPDILITDFRLFNESVMSGINSVLVKPIYKTERIELNYGQNDLSFEFLAIHYADPKKNKYAYILKNYEDNWRYVGNQRTATYPNLPPGNYIFQVKAANNNGVWNEKGKSIEINISPPPWATWWAYLSYIFVGLGFLYSVRNFELKRQKKNNAIKESSLRAEAAELQVKAAEAQAKVIQAENDRKTEELEEARQLQLSMLPKDLPQLPHLDIAVYMKTATEVGGDYYDFHIGIDGTLTVVVGDATGHGMKAGTMVTTTKSLFNVLAPNPNIIETFHEMTRCLKLMHMEKLSMCLTMLKIMGNKMQISAAGMPPVFIYKRDSQTIEEHVIKGMPLGTFNNFPYTLIESELSEGDTILIMSDGFPELLNDNKEMYGYKRARNYFEEIAGETPEEIIAKLKLAGSEWVNDKDPDDDVTFVVIKVK